MYILLVQVMRIGNTETFCQGLLSTYIKDLCFLSVWLSPVWGVLGMDQSLFSNTSSHGITFHCQSNHVCTVVVKKFSIIIVVVVIEDDDDYVVKLMKTQVMILKHSSNLFSHNCYREKIHFLKLKWIFQFKFQLHDHLGLAPKASTS